MASRNVLLNHPLRGLKDSLSHLHLRNGFLTIVNLNNAAFCAASERLQIVLESAPSKALSL